MIFFSTTRIKDQELYVNALCKEIELRKEYLNCIKIKTLYFGGGTPSLLSNKSMSKIIDKLYTTFDFSEVSEITLECNPDDINKNFLKQIKELPINRLSFGVQSFDDRELKMIGRRHNAIQAINAVKEAQNNGFSNISIDLIYGLPLQSVEIFENNINEAIKLNIQHISAYHLSYEKGTPICKLKDKAVSEEESCKMYKLLTEKLKKTGFKHYEISNFAKEGFESKHNSTYWQQKEYLGLGAGAHSYNKISRSWNIADIDKYINNPLENEMEILTEEDIYNELLLTSLRTCKGLSINSISNKFKNHFLKESRKLIKQNLLLNENEIYKLTEESIFLSDYVIRELMI